MKSLKLMIATAALTLTFVATLGAADPFPAGSQLRLGGNNLGTIVFETRRPARMDRYGETSSGPLGVGVREAGIRSSVATPVMVEGSLWGVIAAGSIREGPLPADAEDRLASFTDLVATAVGNENSSPPVFAPVKSFGRVVSVCSSLKLPFSGVRSNEVTVECSSLRTKTNLPLE